MCGFREVTTHARVEIVSDADLGVAHAPVNESNKLTVSPTYTCVELPLWIFHWLDKHLFLSPQVKGLQQPERHASSPVYPHFTCVRNL